MAKVILVIEDDPDQRRLVERTLSASGHRVMTASDGQSGLEMATSLLPKLIILDVVMPRMNGYQTARALKENPVTSKIPILMMTTKEEPVDAFWGTQTGANVFLTKPVDVMTLLATVNRLTDGA